jgi:hypothetical protein
VRDLEALETWQAQRPAAPQVRRSTRYGGHASDESDRALRYDEEEDDDPPQIHMAMSALRNLQLPDEQPEVATLMSAVAAGIAALEQRTPETYRQAMASPDAEKWKEAMGKEYQSCMDQGTWSLVKRADLPRGANVLPVKTVFKIKLDEHGGISQYKARFTPKGFRQKYGKDYFETFARTGQYKSFRTHLSLVAKWDHEVVQMDVPVAFLNADLEEDVYMELPQGFEQDGMVCKLHKSLYGLKQGPRNWDKLIHPFIVHEMGFAATISDPSLYFRRSRTGRLMMIYRFVDDLQGSHHSADAAEFMTLMALLQKRFNVKTMATSTWMLGMRITRDRKLRTITLDQELYITKALERYGLQHCRVVNTPEAVGAAVEVSAALEEPADTQRYMEMTGTLMYAAISTRPDIAHAVHYLASHMQSPTRRHMLAAERVLRYLAGTKEVGLVFGSRNGEQVGRGLPWPKVAGAGRRLRLCRCGLGQQQRGPEIGQRVGGEAQRGPSELEQQEAASGGALNLRSGVVRRVCCHPGGAVAAWSHGRAWPLHTDRFHSVRGQSVHHCCEPQWCQGGAHQACGCQVPFCHGDCGARGCHPQVGADDGAAGRHLHQGAVCSSVWLAEIQADDTIRCGGGYGREAATHSSTALVRPTQPCTVCNASSIHMQKAAATDHDGQWKYTDTLFEQRLHAFPSAQLFFSGAPTRTRQSLHARRGHPPLSKPQLPTHCTGIAVSNRHRVRGRGEPRSGF